MSRTSRTGAVSESGIVYFKAGGHSHDGINSTLIDTKKYSLFDFSVGQQQGSQDRITNQSRNEQSFKEYVIKLVNQSVLEPIGISLQDNAINSRHIIANSISAREIAANTITSDKIALNTITANNFANAIVLDAKIVRSNNYIAGTSGWVINGNGFAEFRNISIGGTSNINGVPIGNIATVVTNFETNNDQIATTPSDANSISFGTAIKNRDASIDLPVTWVYNQGGSTSNSFNVDGFVLYLRSSNTNNNANITISDINNSNVQAVYLTSDKRSHVFSGVPESTSYKAAIRAYRIVDTNVNANGILFSGFINSDIRNIGVPTIGGGTGISIGDGKIFIGAGNYSNTDTGFFVDSDGKMSLKTSFVWDGNALTIGNTATIGNQFVSNISNATFNFDRNNDRNATTPTAPTVASDGSALTQIQNPDSSADITFNWSYTNSTAIGNAANIDGFVVYVRSSPTDTNPYTFGSGGIETPYYLPKDRRSFVLPGVPANYYYTFGVVAYRIVSSDINSQGILFSTIVKSTASGENPLRPFNNVQFAGDITGTVNGLSASVVSESAIDFFANNDRNALKPPAPGLLGGDLTIDHVINTDGSADISFEWTYTSSNVATAYNNIDGFVLYVYASSTNEAYIFGTAKEKETVYYATPEKRAFILQGVAADKYYTFGVQAYRIVDTDISNTNTVVSVITRSTTVGQGTGNETLALLQGSELWLDSGITLEPYRPSSQVAFAGDITGTIGNVAASVVSGAINNFNANNDRKNTTPALANTITFGTAIPNYNSSLDLPIAWTYNNTNLVGDQFDIDGFVLYLKTGTAENNTVANITNTTLNNTSVQTFYITPNKRDHIFSGIEPSVGYKAAIRAYRVVDSDIAANYAGDKEGSMIFGPILNSNVKNWQSPILGGSTGITIGNGKIYIGNGFFNSSNTGFYVDSTGQMSLKNSLVWNGTTLTVNGVINADSGVFKGSIDIGGPDNQSLQVDTDGNLWLGHRTLASAPFRVSPDGQLYVGTSPNWLRVDAEGNVWTGGDTFANAAFRVQDTGNVRIGNAATSLHIANNGSITIGTSPGTGDFIVQSNGQVDVGGNDATSFHISPSGNIWSGDVALANAPFRVDNTGNIRVGNAATSLYITNNGAITIGSTPGTGDFIVQSNGQVDVGGNDLTSFHISPSGNLWVGANSTSFSTAPLKITNDGSVDIGTSDAQSLHISASGNIHVGAAKVNFATAPFSVVASNGDVKGNNITLSGQILGTATHLGKADVVNIIGNIAIGSSKIFATAGANYSNGANYTLSAADGFLAKLDNIDMISITASGYDSRLNVKTNANTYSGEYIRDNAAANLTAYSGGVTARWEDSNNGKLLGKFTSSSKRYKKNIKKITDDDLDPHRLLKLRVVQFKYKSDYLAIDDQRYNKPVPGFIAEEIYELYPIACDLTSNGIPETWNVNFIIPPMLKLIQDLYLKVDQLEVIIKEHKCK